MNVYSLASQIRKSYHPANGRTLRITKIRAFGSVWEEALRKLWQDSTVSLREIARQLGVDASTVKLHAAELELSFPRQGKRLTCKSARTKNARAVPQHELVKQPGVAVATLEAYRSEWAIAREANPKAGRTILKNQF